MRNVAEQIFSSQHKLTTRKRAAAVLRDICEQHEQVALLPNGFSLEMSTILIAVDEAEDWILLDMPIPECSMDELQAMCPLMALARYAGVRVGFQLDAVTRVDWSSGPALKARFPSQVYFQQRRSYFRVQVGPDDVRGVRLIRLGAAPLEGRCHDLSAGGMRLLARPVLGDFPLREGENLVEIQFELRGSVLKVQGRVQHLGDAVRMADGSTMLPIGVEFGHRTPAFEQQVTRYVQERDRELLAAR